MGIAVESDPAALPGLRLLGPIALTRDGGAVALPPSRKLRALLAYLALAREPVSRSQLCELLWDAPSDPRGELRWCLSKLRRLLDSPGRRRVMAHDDALYLDLQDCEVDALAVSRVTQTGLAAIDVATCRTLLGHCRGELLEGLELDRAPLFTGWLTAQRRHFRSCQTALLDRLVQGVDDAEALGYLERWLELAPFERRAHAQLLMLLARGERLREGEEHLAAAVQLFESSGLDAGPLVATWRNARGAGSASLLAVTEPPSPGADGDSAARRRASIAVMPFADQSDPPGGRGGPADALAHDVITRLAKLRSLFVIAQGTVFALHERQMSAGEAGRTLNVDYVVGGAVRRRHRHLLVSVELAETRSARILWAETFSRSVDDAFAVLEEIGNRIVVSVASEIETLERNRAILKPPESLDAWEAFHRGLWHMYRFEKAHNERARALFHQAMRLDPTFSRAYAGLSFTHFQDAFQGWDARAPQTELALQTARQSLLADDRDPAAHWAMGRALWLRGTHAPAVAELAHAVDLSPNYALAHYNLAFVNGTAGDAQAAIASADTSRDLSPFDPMLFGMFGARAMALVRLERFDEAGDWAVKAAARPNAFAHIQAIAAYTLALARRDDEARGYWNNVQQAAPGYRIERFLDAFRFDAHGTALYHEAARRLGTG